MDRAVAWVSTQAALCNRTHYKIKGQRPARDQIVLYKDLQTDYANLIKPIGPIVQREPTGPFGTHKDFAREGIVVFF